MKAKEKDRCPIKKQTPSKIYLHALKHVQVFYSLQNSNKIT